MTTPRIEADLNKIRHNTRHLVERLKPRGISVTAVTKGVCGHPAIAQAMLDGGAAGLADARIENVERLRRAGITSRIAMIRTPMLSQAEQVTRSSDTSYNSEIDVIARLAEAARKKGTVHNIILMAEMGDMREGILPENIEAIARQVIRMSGVALKGIGANFACLSGLPPDTATMDALSTLANDIERACGRHMEIVSGGNSANLPWALGTRPTGRVNNLRLGEAILLGKDPVTGAQIDGLHGDAFKLVAEVIETKVKPGPIEVSFVDSTLTALHLVDDIHAGVRSIVAIGTQDTDISGLTMRKDVSCIGATSDHLVLQTTGTQLRVGSEVEFQMNYSALMRVMNATGVTKVLLDGEPELRTHPTIGGGPQLELV